MEELKYLKTFLNKEQSKNHSDIDWSYVILLEKNIKRLTK